MEKFYSALLKIKMLFNKKATLYSYSRDATTKIATYSQTGIDFACNIQPMSAKDGLDGGNMLKQKKMYCRYDGIHVGDKVVVDGTTYIIEYFQHRDGLRKMFNKAFISESEGN